MAGAELAGVELAGVELAGAELAGCVINISEGRDAALVDEVVTAAGSAFLDLHSDPEHHRSVLTLGGPLDQLEAAVRAVLTSTVHHLDLRRHSGVHPRIGAADVVPFVPLGPAPAAGRSFLVDLDAGRAGTPSWEAARAARDRTAAWAGDELGLPCFLYGPERTLPEVRRHAFDSLAPEFGPTTPHPTAGGAALGVRPVLIAYNVAIEGTDVLAAARELARQLRGPAVRALGLAVGPGAQVSCNLIDPAQVSPADLVEQVEESAGGLGCEVTGTELVGLLPAAVLRGIPPTRWSALDLAEDRTIERRLSPVAG